MYEDPDTDNFFYTRAPTRPKKIEKFNDFGWIRPPTPMAKVNCDRMYVGRYASYLTHTYIYLSDTYIQTCAYTFIHTYTYMYILS